MKRLLSILVLVLAVSPLSLKSSIVPSEETSGGDGATAVEPGDTDITDNLEGGPIITGDEDGGPPVIYYSFNTGSTGHQPKPSSLDRKFRGSLRGAGFTRISHGGVVSLSVSRQGVLSGMANSGRSAAPISGTVGRDGRIIAKVAGGGTLKGRLQNGVIVGGINGGPCHGSLLATEVR